MVVAGFSILPLVISVLAYAPRFTKQLLWISPGFVAGSELDGKQSSEFAVLLLCGPLMPIGLSIVLGLVILGTIHRCNLDTEESERMENAIEMVHVTKKFKETVAVNGVTVSLEKKERFMASSDGTDPARRYCLSASAACFR